MKLFFTVFGAILAAAAVIWGVFSYRENQTKNKQATLDSLKQSIRLAEKYNELLLLQGGEIDPARARHTVILLESFASVIKRDLPDGYSSHGLLTDFIYQYKRAIDYTRQHPERYVFSLNWAEEIEDKLFKLFPNNFALDKNYRDRQVELIKEKELAEIEEEEKRLAKKAFAPIARMIELNLRSIISKISGSAQVKQRGYAIADSAREFSLHELVGKGLEISYPAPILREDYGSTKVSILKGRVLKLTIVCGEHTIEVRHSSEVPIQ